MQLSYGHALKTRGDQAAARLSVLRIFQIGIARKTVGEIDDETVRKALVHARFGADIGADMDGDHARQAMLQGVDLVEEFGLVGDGNGRLEADEDTVADHGSPLSDVGAGARTQVVALVLEDLGR